jgi:type I site-specific restriction endonuclease
MNEAETRAELIDPALRAAGWGVVKGSKIHCEYPISAGKIQVGGRGKRDIAEEHAALIRDLVNQNVKENNPFYCVRVTANDGEEGERQLREFQDNEKIIPTILTTSQKLSTGVDVRNIRNIVLLRPVNSMEEYMKFLN